MYFPCEHVTNGVLVAVLSLKGGGAEPWYFMAGLGAGVLT